jgi:hypothetical protein
MINGERNVKYDHVVIQSPKRSFIHFIDLKFIF